MLFLLLLCVLTVLVACADNKEVVESEEETSHEESEQQTKEQEPEESEPELKNSYPFTGEKTNDEVNDRAVAVMINNDPKARPQSGLSKADVVYEFLIESNVTRFLAVFQSEKPDKVGPVRSARPYFYETAKGLGAIYVHHGAATKYENVLKAGYIDRLSGMIYDNDGHLFKREDFRVAPHNSYLLFDGVYEKAKQKGYETTAQHSSLPFKEADQVNEMAGQVIEEVSFNYSSIPVRYVYDTAKQKYLRFNGEEQTVEYDANEPILLDNVFIIETKHEIVDSVGHKGIDLKSGGNALLLQNGKMQKLQWKNIDGRILPVKNGEEVGFVPGKTWVNVIPTSPGLDAVTTN